MGLFRKKKIPQTTQNKLYELVADPYDLDSEYWCVKIMEGDYAGLIYRYNKLNFNANDKTDHIAVNFEYDLVFVPEEIRKKEFPNHIRKEFETLLGNIMHEVLEEAMKNGDYDYGSAGDNDSTEFTIKRKLHEKGNPFS